MRLTSFSRRTSGRDLSAVRRSLKERRDHYFQTSPTGLTPAPEAVATAAPDLSEMKKAELVELAERMNLDTSGNKADLVERIESFDG